MAETKNNALDAILKQYEENSKPKNNGGNSFDLKNYFSTFLEKGVNKASKRIRILPSQNEGETPFSELYIHAKEVDGKKRKFTCLKEMYDKDCPFCEAREELYSSGKDEDKEIAKKYYPRRTYVCRVIDRDKEDEGVKFWRFNHDFRNQGTFDKIIDIVASKGDVTDPETGRDLMVHIKRDQNGNCVISSITDMDPSPIHEDEEKAKEWVESEKTWEDVYSVKGYDYLEIIVKGGIPVFDKENKCFVDKLSLEEENSESENDLDKELKEEEVGNEVDATDTKDLDGDSSDSSDSGDDDDDLPF